MSAMRISVVLACTALAVATARASEPELSTDQGTILVAPAQKPAELRKPSVNHTRPHDASRTVVRVAHASAHEGAAAGVVRPVLADARNLHTQRVAVLDRPSGACDSILCPGYAMMGVGF